MNLSLSIKQKKYKIGGEAKSRKYAHKKMLLPPQVHGTCMSNATLNENVRIFVFNAQRVSFSAHHHVIGTQQSRWFNTNQRTSSVANMVNICGMKIQVFFFHFNPFDASNCIYYLKMHSLVLQSCFSHVWLFMQRFCWCPTSGSTDYGSILHRASSCCNDRRT